LNRPLPNLQIACPQCRLIYRSLEQQITDDISICEGTLKQMHMAAQDAII